MGPVSRQVEFRGLAGGMDGAIVHARTNLIGSMLARLNKPLRLKAGWCIALAYLFCVLAPSMSFAFADGSRSAPCIIEDHDPGMHMHGSAIGEHVHDAPAVHGHAHDLSMTHEGMPAHEDGLPDKDPHKSADMRCCGLVSVSAIPASETVLAQPTVLASRCEAVSTRNLADNAPPRHYRPPIS